MADSVGGILFLAGIVTAALWDVFARRVPNAINLAYGGFGCLIAAWLAGWRGLGNAGLGIAVGLAVVLIPFAMRIYRGGDAKLIIALGAWLGPLKILWAFGIGVVLGGVLGVLMIVGDPKTRRLVAESVKASALTKTVPVVAERNARRHVPMAVAFGLGACIARWWL